MGSALKGVQTGMAFNQLENQQELTDQKIQLQNQMIQQNVRKQQADVAKTQANLRLQEDLADLATDYSPDKAERVLIKNPSLIKDMLPLFQNMDSKQKSETVGDLMRLHHQSINNPEGVIEELKNRYETFEEAGDVENANLYKGFYENAKANEDNDSVKAILDIGIGSLLGPKEYSEYHKRLAETAKFKKETEYYDREYKLEQQKVKNETNKILNEAKKLKNSGLMTTKDRIRLELDLRNQYWKEGGEKYERVNTAYNNIKDSSITGVGGLTTILSFMKAIDPSSTVTGGEVLTAKKAPGIWSSGMIQVYNDVFKKGAMTETAREQFLAEAKNLRDNAKKQADKPRARITSQAKGTGLKVSNIFTPKAKVEKADDPLLDLAEPQSNIIEGDANIGVGGSGANLEQKKTRASNFLNQFPN